MSRAIELSPDSPTAYFNRGLVHSELRDWRASLSDLRRAQELGPDEPVYASTLCLQMAVTGNPEGGLPYCDRAAAAGPEGRARDVRGLALALLGRAEDAVADFEAFLAWVEASPNDECRSRYGSTTRSWTEALKRGEDPFDPAAVEELRARPALPGTAPC